VHSVTTLPNCWPKRPVFTVFRPKRLRPKYPGRNVRAYRECWWSQSDWWWWL